MSNESLRNLLKEAKCTNHNLALAVNRVAAESGMTLRYDRTTVSHWLGGSRPRHPVPVFIAEAFTRRLGRPITVAATGFSDETASEFQLPPDDSAGIPALLRLVAADLDPGGRAVLYELPYRVDWAVPPAWPPHHRTATRTPARGSSPFGVGPDAVEAVRTTTAAFSVADKAFGSGRGLSALTAYLTTDITAWLAAEAVGQIRCDLLSAVASLLRLIGAMSFDSLRHHLAQRYYQCALHLSLEAGDLREHVAILRDMSAQARFLGHHRLAIHLTEAALGYASTSVTPEARAALLGEAAIAHAALDHRRTALACLAKAELCLGHADSAEASAVRADLAYRTGRTLALLRDSAGAEAALRRSLRHRTTPERRSRMLTTHHLAEVQFGSGRLEQACATWQGFLDEYPHMNSARVNRVFQTMRGRLLPHHKNIVVAKTIDRLDGLAAG
ncbi:hypothetical protein ACFFQW_38485 [Umezawaea endophytica]|uniref:Transcriptional regulator n=1 Tax=Umezawaea endophytica TaxID=1654476 RepID=A0A9X2VX91_9PSEU|nr:hypothetical protein [Umezawaea endophytica]MCS7483832.1 hypothetical protein [Umezawaea endophytica]